MSDEDILKVETLMSIDGVKFIPVCSTKDIELAMEEDTLEWAKIDIAKPISINVDIRAKKKGTLLEKSLYYQRSKKRRIRKKWSIEKVLGIKEE